MPEIPKKTLRSRTFTGCRTCRDRHAKCDDVQPVCGTCLRLGIDCEGYEPRLFWLTGSPSTVAKQQQNHRSNEYRYPLFSEADRHHMSAQLTQSLGDRSAGDILNDLDSQSEKQQRTSGEVPQQLTISVGPFSVFSTTCAPEAVFESPQSSLVCTTGEEISDSSPEQAQDVDQQVGESFLDDMGYGGMGESDLDSFFDTLDPALRSNQPLITDANLPYLITGDPQLIDLFCPEPLSDILFSPRWATPNLAGIDHGRIDEEETDLHDTSTTLAITPILSSPGTTRIPEHAEYLLRSYKHYMDQYSPSQARRKSPWQILFIPCALQTYAEMSLWNQTSHTKLCILYALLANSAFQLHHSGRSEPACPSWLEIGEENKANAKQHLRKALQSEFSGQAQAKYTELLMAILLMAMVSLYHGTENFKMFLLDAEQLIRLRGIPSPKSFKIRLLHHMYTHLRILAESTSIFAVTNEGANEAGKTAVAVRKFRIGEEALNKGLDPAHEKDLEAGYNDIHLEVQGHFKETLFPDIYGIPESLITLLSQVISLANEKARLDMIARIDPAVSDALARHVKTLENSIWSWTLPDLRTYSQLQVAESGGEADHGLLDQPTTRSMVLAMHQALVIYFYRRIHNLSAMVLQDSVRKTLDYLMPCLDERSLDQDVAITLAWPAFIAACEAVTPELQVDALKCLSTMNNKGSLFASDAASKIVSSIWSKRSMSGDWSFSWPNLTAGVL